MSAFELVSPNYHSCSVTYKHESCFFFKINQNASSTTQNQGKLLAQENITEFRKLWPEVLFVCFFFTEHSYAKIVSHKTFKPQCVLQGRAFFKNIYSRKHKAVSKCLTLRMEYLEYFSLNMHFNLSKH